MEDQLMLNEDELIEYVQERLLKDGYAVSKEALSLVFAYELDYMVENGFAVPVDDE